MAIFLGVLAVGPAARLATRPAAVGLVPDAATDLPDADRRAADQVAPRPLRLVLNWGRRYSLWVFNFGLACCAIEFIAASMARHDFIRLGVIPFAPGPRQADLMVVSGTVTDKMAPAIRRLYEQMPEPKYVISFGACSNSGGPYWDSYCVTKGVDQVIPVDVYVPGCPPRPEALLHGIIRLQQKIAAEQLSGSAIEGRSVRRASRPRRRTVHWWPPTPAGDCGSVACRDPARRGAGPMIGTSEQVAERFTDGAGRDRHRRGRRRDLGVVRAGRALARRSGSSPATASAWTSSTGSPRSTRPMPPTGPGSTSSCTSCRRPRPTGPRVPTGPVGPVGA